MSKTITWDRFRANRHIDRALSSDGKVYYSASTVLDGKQYNSEKSEQLLVADANLMKLLAKDGYIVTGYTPPEDSPAAPTTHDPVNNPEHYTRGGIECIDAIESALTPEEFRGYCKGNALKYIWRAEHKGKPSEDIKKAVWYLKRLGGEYDS